MGYKPPKSEKTEVRCTSIFKNSATIGDSINKLWAEVINVLENASNDREMQRHAYPSSEEFEVSSK